MTIQLVRIDSSDRRVSAELQAGEVVTHEVVVSIDGRSRTFRVYVKAKVLPAFDAVVVYGDELLEELLRFEPAALNALYQAVGKYRRGTSVSLPLILVDSGDAPEIHAGMGPA
jgi:hypothetical protein